MSHEPLHILTPDTILPFDTAQLRNKTSLCLEFQVCPRRHRQLRALAAFGAVSLSGVRLFFSPLKRHLTAVAKPSLARGNPEVGRLAS